MKISRIATIALLGATLSMSVLAQPGPGWGKRGGYRFDQSNTPGWTLMTEAERNAHREKMWSAKSYDECKAIQAEHHKLMEARAKEKNVTLRQTRYNACDRMKARGIFK